MKISARLNMVVPVPRDGGTLYVHAMPLSAEAWEANFEVIAATHTSIYRGGIEFMGGPRVAALSLRKVAERMGCWDGPEGVQRSLMAEIRRLSNVVVPGADGWTVVPLQTALDQGLMEPREVAEVEGAIVFFILSSEMQTLANLPGVMAAVASLWGTRTTLLNVTEFQRSLPTSTADENTGAGAAPSAAAPVEPSAAATGALSVPT